MAHHGRGRGIFGVQTPGLFCVKSWALCRFFCGNFLGPFSDNFRLCCHSWQSRVADVFCCFWAVSSGRPAKSGLEGCAANLVPPTGIAGAFQHGSLDHAQKAAKECPRVHVLKTPPRARLLNRKKPQRVLGGLTGGFVARFCGRFLGLAGGFKGGHAPAVSCFRLADLLADFFRGFFFCMLQPKESMYKSTTSMAAFWKIFHRLNPQTGREQIPCSALVPSLKLESGNRFVCPFYFATSKELLEHGNRSSGNPKTSRL